MAVIAIDRLSKRYGVGSELAVKDVSLTVADGEFMVLLGPSGCGKSSILRMIAGLEPISAGTVALDGAIINHVPAKDRDIAMVFQSYALYPHMDVEANLAFGLRRRKRRRGTRSTAGFATPRTSSASRPISSASRTRSRAASASAWRSAARSSATPRSSCSTSRSRTSMQPFASRPATS